MIITLDLTIGSLRLSATIEQWMSVVEDASSFAIFQALASVHSGVSVVALFGIIIMKQKHGLCSNSCAISPSLVMKTSAPTCLLNCTLYLSCDMYVTRAQRSIYLFCSCDERQQILELCANEIDVLEDLCWCPPPLVHLGLGYNRLASLGPSFVGPCW